MPTRTAAPATPPISWYRDPGFTALTPFEITDEGKVSGHLAGWGSQHRGMPGRNITPPRSRTGYRSFTTGVTQVLDSTRRRNVPSGNLTIGGPHAGSELDAEATRDHYDRSTTIFATCAAGEDAHGIWVAGALMPDVDEITLRRARACSLSGDWRSVNGRDLDLVAALAVVVPGFEVPRSRVASGRPLSLVAAGALRPTLAQQHAALVAELDDSIEAQHARLLAEFDW